MRPKRNVKMQRAVVLQVLFGESDFEQDGWSRDEIKEALGSPALVDDALTVLRDEGVVVIHDDGGGEDVIEVSRCVKHLVNICLLAV